MNLTINDTTISYHVYGKGKTIYFLHGLGLDHQSMVTIYESFFDSNHEIRRVYIDLPGMGDSPADQSLNSSDTVVNCIKQFIELDSKNDAVALVGHSYGAYLSLGLAYLLKNKITEIFLTCPVTIANTKNRNKEIAHSIIEEQFVPHENQAFFDEFLSMNTIINPTTWRMYQQMILPGLMKFNHSFWHNLQTTNYAFSFENKLTSLSNQLSGVVLLGKHDSMVGYQDQKNLFSHFHTIKTVIAENAGHNLPIDVPSQVQFLFEEWLMQI